MYSAVPNFSLESKTIVITGGYGQIGQSFVKGCFQAGASVAILEPGASESRTKDLFGDDYKSGKIEAFKADVTSKASLEKACEQITKRFGVPDGLINNAALDSPPLSLIHI